MEVARRLAELVEVSAGSEATPLLVNLYVDEALDLLLRGQPFDALPGSIPEIYFRYVDRVNPANKEADDFVPADSMRRAAAILAAYSVRRNYVPRDFVRSLAERELAKFDFPKDLIRPVIERLKNNGVIRGNYRADDEELRFILDPLAEYLGAFWLAQEWSEDVLIWRERYTEICARGHEADGFRVALELVHRAYAAKWGWPDWRSIAPNADDVTTR